MISLEQFKNALGKEAERLTEKEILELQKQQDEMAEIFFNSWLANIKQDEV